MYRARVPDTAFFHDIKYIYTNTAEVYRAYIVYTVYYR